jgi:hypothetical protein
LPNDFNIDFRLLLAEVDEDADEEELVAYAHESTFIIAPVVDPDSLRLL